MRLLILQFPSQHIQGEQSKEDEHGDEDCPVQSIVATGGVLRFQVFSAKVGARQILGTNQDVLAYIAKFASTHVLRGDPGAHFSGSIEPESTSCSRKQCKVLLREIVFGCIVFTFSAKFDFPISIILRGEINV